MKYVLQTFTLSSTKPLDWRDCTGLWTIRGPCLTEMYPTRMPITSALNIHNTFTYTTLTCTTQPTHTTHSHYTTHTTHYITQHTQHTPYTTLTCTTQPTHIHNTLTHKHSHTQHTQLTYKTHTAHTLSHTYTHSCTHFYTGCFLNPLATGPQYTFVRDMRMVEVDGVLTCVCVAKSAVFPNEPEKEGIIRVDDFQQACVLQSDGKTGSRGDASSLLSPCLPPSLPPSLPSEMKDVLVYVMCSNL